MQMKKTICLTGLLQGTNHGCITTSLNKSVLQRTGNIPVNLQPKSLRLCHQLGRLCLLWFGILRECVNSTSYCEVLLKLWDAIHRKFADQIARGVLLRHVNARPIQPKQCRREFKNFLNVCLTAQTWLLVTAICLVC
jgi:hypothetical protein